MLKLIPEQVIQFLVEHIDSIAELEILVLLRDYRDRDWSSSAVADRIYSSEEVAAKILAKLTDLGFITAAGSPSASFRYGPRNEELAQRLDQLAEAYAKYLVPVTELVHRKSRRNIEGLAEAFRFRKEK